MLKGGTASREGASPVIYCGLELNAVKHQHSMQNCFDMCECVKLTFKVQWYQAVTFNSVQCHPGLT